MTFFVIGDNNLLPKEELQRSLQEVSIAESRPTGLVQVPVLPQALTLPNQGAPGALKPLPGVHWADGARPGCNIHGTHWSDPMDLGPGVCRLWGLGHDLRTIVEIRFEEFLQELGAVALGFQSSSRKFKHNAVVSLLMLVCFSVGRVWLF